MKKLKEAFIKYHINENQTYLKVNCNNYSYNKIKIGDIVFVSKYKYNSFKKGEYHLFLVINKYGIYIHGMLITSKIEKEWYLSNILIKRDQTNNLNYDSLIKTDNIYIIDKQNIINCIGKVNKKFLKKCLILNKLI